MSVAKVIRTRTWTLVRMLLASSTILPLPPLCLTLIEASCTTGGSSTTILASDTQRDNIIMGSYSTSNLALVLGQTMINRVPQCPPTHTDTGIHTHTHTQVHTYTHTPVDDTSSVQVVNCRHNLPHVFPCFHFLQSCFIIDMLHQLSTWQRREGEISQLMLSGERFLYMTNNCVSIVCRPEGSLGWTLYIT